MNVELLGYSDADPNQYAIRCSKDVIVGCASFVLRIQLLSQS